MSEQAQKRPGRRRGAPVLRLRMRVMAGASIAIGPGKIELLEAIREARSITAAAKAMAMSYRRAWMLVDEVNRSLKKPAVASAIGGDKGGGSELTATGELLVRTYRRIEANAAASCAKDIETLTGLVRPAAAAGDSSLKRSRRST